VNKAVYIIGSYAAYDEHSERVNITRAVALGSLALATGHVPIVPHITIGCSSLLLGQHSDVDADALAREASYGKNGSGGLAAMLRDSCASMDVSLWVILRDDGTMSSGTKAEYDEFTSDPIGVGAISLTWEDWGSKFAAAGLETLYALSNNAKKATFPCWPGDPGTRVRITHSVARPVSFDEDTSEDTYESSLDFTNIKTLDDLVKAVGPDGPSTCGCVEGTLDELTALSEEAGGYTELDDGVEREPLILNVSKIGNGLHADSVKCMSCRITTHRKVDGSLVQVAKHLDTCAKVQSSWRQSERVSLRSMLVALKEKTGRDFDLCEKAVRATHLLMFWDYDEDRAMELGPCDPNHPVPAAMEPHVLLWLQENTP
jgi:hypothetical protein